MRTILNVDANTVRLDDLVAVLQRNLGTRFLEAIYPERLHEGGPTHVVVLSYDYTGYVFDDVLTTLAGRLGEDCIAAADFDAGVLGNGRLLGPRADAWGDFNADFFHVPSEIY